MKITFRLRFIPLNSFLTFYDLKTGVQIALMFALFNKVAGVYGLIAVLTGAGGNVAQITMYIYSVLALVGLAYAMKASSQEDPQRMLYFAHLFFADHILSTSWTAYFAVRWWFYTKHDGHRDAKSSAQEDIAKNAGVILNLSDEERVQAAQKLWNQEKGQAAAVILCGWLIKFIFIYLIYSYAHHLRKGTYRSLPSTRSSSAYTNSNGYTSLPTRFSERDLDGTSALGVGLEDEDELELDYYRGASPSTRRFKTAPGAGAGLGVGNGMGLAGSASASRSARRSSVIAALGAGTSGEGEVLFDGGDEEDDVGQHR